MQSCLFITVQCTAAVIIALNRANISKCLSHLKEEGIIATHREWIEIISSEALMDCCCEETVPSDV